MITYSRVLGNIRSLPNGEDSRIQYNPGFLDLYLMLVGPYAKLPSNSKVKRKSMNPDLAGGMADGAVSFLLQKLEAFASTEWNLQENIRNGVRELQRELWRIEAMMRDADAKKDYDNQFNVWIQEVRTEAYAIEDVLDLFRLHWDQESVWRHLKMWHSISNLIQDINTRLAIIKQTKERYQIIKEINERYPMMVPTNSVSSETNTYHNVRAAPLILGWGNNTMGIDEPKRKLVSWASKSNQKLKVMFLVGMAGLGKTTLAYRVYEEVKEHFDCHAWIIASKYQTIDETLRSLLEELGSSTEGSGIVLLMQRLHNFLQHKRYVIVVDNLLVKDVWESIRLALPDGNDNRIIITTRRGDIANSCRDDSIDIHKVQPLSLQWAEQLFYKKAFLGDGSCPSGLEEVSKSILQKCDGLPLGIIEIGRVLRSKPRQTKYEWKKLHDSLESELRSGGALSDIMRVFSASYKDLPYHLKYCFLYMSIFPENNPVKRRRLIRLWIAEGFVTEERGKTLEEVGEEYLNELIGRSLIKANEMDFDGRPITVGVHSLMHRIILSVSQEENFCTVCAGPEGNLTDKPRRLSIQTGNFDVSQDLTCVRTFFSFSTGRINIGSNFKLLKVLDIQSTPLGNFPSAITDLVLLSAPFDIVQGFKAPKGIDALKNLQKLSFVKASGQHRMIQGLDNLTQLRKLGIVELAEEHGASLCLSIEKMPNLHSLNVTSLNKEELLELDAMTNPPPLLQRLYLRGPLERFPRWVSSLHDLERIRLKWSSLTENPIGALQNLPNLTELQLLDAYTGTQLDFNSGKFQNLKILDLEQLKQLRFIIMEDGTLPCLQKLIIRQCNELEHVPVGIDGLHHLNELHLCDMPEKLVAQLKKNGGQFRHLVHHIPYIHSYNQGQLEDLS
ncbi:Disease resistance protein RPM1 [Vitis vinifera]|uniref:Disease resistance protein RPM1 n=1 Tax=Vitis vinifera TaxID=29760 RepID=A0A438E395_VITVI|nr:Disease resistance protein RPM1 [Vitis vinifera]